MPIEVLTESKTKILPKKGVALGRVYIDVSTIDEVADVEVDTNKVDENKTGILTDVDDVVVSKLKNSLE